MEEPRTECRRRIGLIEITAYTGDLTRARVDAIVNPANSYMVMGGGVAGVIKRRGGRVIEDEARRYAPVPVGKAVATTAGRLPAKYVIHSPTMEEPAGETSFEKVYLASKAALEVACRLDDVSSIAFPGMGTGVGGLDYRVASKAMLKAFLEYSSSRCIDEIRVIDINPLFIKAFCETLESGLDN